MGAGYVQIVQERSGVAHSCLSTLDNTHQNIVKSNIRKGFQLFSRCSRDHSGSNSHRNAGSTLPIVVMLSILGSLESSWKVDVIVSPDLVRRVIGG